ncbi:hypothetical protein HSX11_22095 [Oxalobacteraceae bacterium]|nr:hypothetical protein [Oxalobacteraceae bacterium]
MSINRFEWIALAAVMSVPLCYYGWNETAVSSGFSGQESVHGGGAASTEPSFPEGAVNCSGVMYTNPFGRSKADCAAIAPATDSIAAASGNASALRTKLAQVAPCKGSQQANNLSRDCVEQNAVAAGLVRQLEALVEQGQPEASAELAKVVEREGAARTANGEYLDEIERAEAVLMRIAASGGIEADKKIARPHSPSADGPRFATGSLK